MVDLEDFVDTHPHRDFEHRQREDPRTTDLSADPAGLSTENIITGPRQRHTSSRAQIHFASVCQDPLFHQGFFSGFASGATFSVFSTQRPLHRDTLPELPETWQDLRNHPFRFQFIEAAKLEIANITRLGTYKAVKRPERKRVIPLKWVFSYKFDEQNNLTKLKARICARGDLQPFTDNDARSVTLASRIFRFLMAVMAHFDMDSMQLDAINAFCNSPLDEEVYGEFPDGSSEQIFDEFCGINLHQNCLLFLYAIYGLRRSPVLWYNEYTTSLKSFGLTPIPEEPCLLTAPGLIVFFHVDDTIILSHKEKRAARDALVQFLTTKYEMHILGEIAWFLNIRITRNRTERLVYLTQDTYIDKLVKDYNIDTTGSAHTPLSDSFVFIEIQFAASPQFIFAFQRRIGSIIYIAVMTRPDVCAAVIFLARFSTKPNPQLFEQVNHIISYLYTTKHYSICFGVVSLPSTLTFFGASDAAFADLPNRTSTEGFVFTLFGGPVDWKSNRQRSVTKSTTESELYSLSRAASESIWWERFFKQFQFHPGQPVTLYSDNLQATGLMTKNAPFLDTKLRHVDIHQHWLRERVQRGDITINWLPTARMPADGLTKRLSRQNHQKFLQLLGMKDIRHLIPSS